MLFDQGGDKLSNIATICQTDQPLQEALEVPQNSDKSFMKGLVVYLVMPPAASAGLGSFEAREAVTDGTGVINDLSLLPFVHPQGEQA